MKTKAIKSPTKLDLLCLIMCAERLLGKEVQQLSRSSNFSTFQFHHIPLHAFRDDQIYVFRSTLR